MSPGAADHGGTPTTVPNGRREGPSADRQLRGREPDRQDLSRAARERIRERAATRAELDDTIVAGDAGVGDELRSEARATEEVLAEPTPPGASGRYVPGHGRPRPLASLRGERA